MKRLLTIFLFAVLCPYAHAWQSAIKYIYLDKSNRDIAFVTNGLYAEIILANNETVLIMYKNDKERAELVLKTLEK